jgi:hypothetical protein
LLDQWQERLGRFLDLPAKSIGHIGGGKMERTGCVDVAVIQSLYRKDEVKDFVAEYGQVIVDDGEQRRVVSPQTKRKSYGCIRLTEIPRILTLGCPGLVK